jgi:hypothetical protein
MFNCQARPSKCFSNPEALVVSAIACLNIADTAHEMERKDQRERRGFD